MAWEIKEMQGLGPISFGMPLQSVEALVGASTYEDSDDPNDKEFEDYGLRILFAENRVIEISVSPSEREDIMFQNLNVFRDDRKQVLRLLEKTNGPVFENVGFLLFARLGIMATGLHDNDDSQLAITLQPKPMDLQQFSFLEPISFA